jgi:hypothetical protein
MNEIISEQSSQNDEKMIREATTYTRVGGMFFCGDSATGSFYGTGREAPDSRINFSDEATVWVDNGFGGVTPKTLGEWMEDIVRDANSKVDALLHTYEKKSDMSADDVSNAVVEIMKSMHRAADALWSEGDAHSSDAGKTFISLDTRTAVSRGISLATVDARQTARDAVHAARTQISHAATAVAMRSRDLLQSAVERDAAEHADEYEATLSEFRKESAKDKLKNEILAISDPDKRADAMRRYSRVFVK